MFGEEKLGAPRWMTEVSERLRSEATPQAAKGTLAAADAARFN